jgi:hypothetical protein
VLVAVSIESWATLVIAAAGALFTAVAALAAFLTARTARVDADLRAQPHLAAGRPEVSESGDEVVVTLKNLGLGPARLVAVGVFVPEVWEYPMGVYLSPGLAPMEAETVSIPLLLWRWVDPPTMDDIKIRGECQDASGHDHPLYVRGRPEPLERGWAERTERLEQDTAVQLRHSLKAVVRAYRSGNPSLLTTAWTTFWLCVEARGIHPAEPEEQVATDWEALGGVADQFRRRSDLILTDADRRRYDEERRGPSA